MLTQETISAIGMVRAATFYIVEALMMMTSLLVICAVHAVAVQMFPYKLSSSVLTNLEMPKIMVAMAAIGMTSILTS